MAMLLNKKTLNHQTGLELNMPELKESFLNGE